MSDSGHHTNGSARPLARFGDLLLYIFAAFSFTTAAVAGYNALYPQTTADAAGRLQPVPNWRELIQYGQLLGDHGATIRVVEFADFQCPACARAAAGFRQARAGAITPFQVAVLPLPLTTVHPHAFAAAIAAACADRQGRFAAFHDSLYARQNEIGKRGWNAFARDTGVPNLEAFESCLADSTAAGAVTVAVGKATQLGVISTPAFIVDGMLYPPATPFEEILSVLARPPAPQR